MCGSCAAPRTAIAVSVNGVRHEIEVEYEELPFVRAVPGVTAVRFRLDYTNERN